MATRSTISIVQRSGIVSEIYCHFDGYLSNNGVILLENYVTYEQVMELIGLGSISSLGAKANPEPDTNHTFDSPQKDVTVAYHRDRGEDLQINDYESILEWKLSSGEAYNYIFMDGEWYVGRKNRKLLAEAIEENI